MTQVPKFLLGLDVEASGMGLRTNFLIQIGLALVDVEKGTVVDSFSSYVAQPPGTTWEERCVKDFWEKNPEQYERAKIGLASAPSSDEVAKELMKWVESVVADPDNTRLVVDTAGFDAARLDMLLGSRSHAYLFTDPTTKRPKYTDALEISSWYFGVANVCDPDASSWKESLRALGEEAETDFGVAHDHDAANDAAVIALRAAWAMRQLRKRKTEPAA